MTKKRITPPVTITLPERLNTYGPGGLERGEGIEMTEITALQATGETRQIWIMRRGCYFAKWQKMPESMRGHWDGFHYRYGVE
jgi:hypothetical protein